MSVSNCAVTVGEAQCHWPPFHPCCWGFLQGRTRPQRQAVIFSACGKIIRGQWVTEISLPCMCPMCMPVSEVQLYIKILFKKQFIPMGKYIWGYTVVCARDGWEHGGYWMCIVSAVELTQAACAEWIGIPLTEAIWKGASWLCRLSVCLFCPCVCQGVGGWAQ